MIPCFRGALSKAPHSPRTSISRVSSSGEWRPVRSSTTLPVSRAVTIPPRPRLKGGKDPVSGLSDWQGLWDTKQDSNAPIDKDMMHELIKYGDFTEATYQNFVKGSDDGKTDGLPKYPPEEIFQKVTTIPDPTNGMIPILPGSKVLDYEVLDMAHYITATSGFFKNEIKVLPRLDKTSTNWIGYVAVQTKNVDPKVGRDVVIAWRGTIAMTEWLTDATSEIRPWDEATFANGSDPQASNCVGTELGFTTMYCYGSEDAQDVTPLGRPSVQGQVQNAVRSLLRRYDDITTITTCGHSLGGALASLSAFALTDFKINRAGDQPDGTVIPVTAFTFEAPRVGNQLYSNAYKNREELKMLRIVNLRDIVTKVPLEPWNWSYLNVWNWSKLAEYLANSIGSLEQNSNKMYHHGGMHYEVDTRALWSTKPPMLENLIPFDADKGIHFWRIAAWLLKHPGFTSPLRLLLAQILQFHSFQTILYMVDPSRPKKLVDPKYPDLPDV